MTKSELRKVFLAKQRALSVSDRREKSIRIFDRFFANVALTRPVTLHCFIPIEKFSEVDTRLLFEKLWIDYPNVSIVVPRVDIETGVMESVPFNPASELAANPWDILEPTSMDTVDTKSIDIVLVPGLCFDLLGHRVGYGKGFYDRFLSQCRADCKKIGLSYFPPVPAILDTAAHDVTLTHCITPDKIYSFIGE